MYIVIGGTTKKDDVAVGKDKPQSKDEQPDGAQKSDVP